MIGIYLASVDVHAGAGVTVEGYGVMIGVFAVAFTVGITIAVYAVGVGDI